MKTSATLLAYLGLSIVVSARSSIEDRNDMSFTSHQYRRHATLRRGTSDTKAMSPRNKLEELLDIPSSASVRKRGLLNSPLPTGGDGSEGPLTKILGDLTGTGSNGFLPGLLEGVPPYDPCVLDGPIPPSAMVDAPFTQGINSYQKSIVCTEGTNGSRGIVLLIPGTAFGGKDTFSKSPLGIGLPKLGFSVYRSLGDMQLTGEFVAFAIQTMAKKSLHGQISVVTYSQGGSNSFPSTRSQVINLVMLAAPLKGTAVASVACEGLTVAGGCLSSPLQMRIKSRYIRALNSRADTNSGAQALVQTTSIYSYMDEVVLPQSDSPDGVSWLEGAANIAVQRACGSSRFVDHFAIITDSVAYGLTIDALLNKRPASLDTFDRSYCERVADDILHFSGRLTEDLKLAYRLVLGYTGTRVGRIANTLTSLQVELEPLLQPHQCQRGYASPGDCLPQPGYCRKPHRSIF
ncbi:hypothetical protein CROQUDRAFT_725175 [Cronartium quercuum f. sp. fusiforme G11]|uniref:Uncharacterized protein n=1 Tax=Cronartium quercuum f. sp. fusiforme G11 TaxID=708437 RepID=A0A9P6NB48_9BASI|nr:hypothetical protein CROQUDRAFT_725175 [Cronartium quercuum f. sp. fusiforme G11]